QEPGEVPRRGGALRAPSRASPAEPGPDEAAGGLREAPAAPHVAAANPQISRTAVQITAAAEPVVTGMPRTRALRLVPLLRSSLPRQFVRVPTHAVGGHPEQRQYPRAKLQLPVRLRAVGGEPEPYPIT